MTKIFLPPSTIIEDINEDSFGIEKKETFIIQTIMKNFEEEE